MTLSEFAQGILRHACPTAVHPDGSHTATVETHCAAWAVTFKAGEYGVYEILFVESIDSPNQV